MSSASAIATTMPSSVSPQQPLQSTHTNNQDNRGIIGNGSNNVVNSGIIIEINGPEDEVDRLLGPHISEDALRSSFYSPPECHPNTRTTVRNEIGWWIDESESAKSPLLWLNGPAAVGKSVIAKTISGFHDQIVATFFFSTSSGRSAATLFPTLAWQLARSIPDTRKHIVASLKSNCSLQTSQIEEQFDLLIIQPLKESATTSRSRPVMVIDGVDECTDEDMLSRLLRVLVQAGNAGDIPVRFIICSRPEPRIHALLGRVRDANPSNPSTNRQKPSRANISVALCLLILFPGAILGLACLFTASSLSNTMPIFIPSILLLTILAFTLYSAKPSRLFLRLGGVWKLFQPIRLGADKGAAPSETCNELPDTLDTICPHAVISTIQIGFSQECKEDIARYLTDTFNEICQPGESTSPWFRQSDISNLVESSCGQFLYASTIVRLLDESFDPTDVLKMARRSSLPTPDLNKLYRAILKRVEDTVRKQAKEGGPDFQTEWGFVMDSLAILVFFARNDHFFTVRKSHPVIETLLGLENGKLTLKLRKMHSVLRIGIAPEESIQVYHRSFLEFLQSRKRAEEYYIGLSNGLRRSLFLMMQAGLRYGSKMVFYTVVDIM